MTGNGRFCEVASGRYALVHLPAQMSCDPPPIFASSFDESRAAATLTRSTLLDRDDLKLSIRPPSFRQRLSRQPLRAEHSPVPRSSTCVHAVSESSPQKSRAVRAA